MIFGFQVTKTNSAEELLNIRVLDKLLNIGPCKKITGGCPSISTYFQETPRKDPLFDLVNFFKLFKVLQKFFICFQCKNYAGKKR